MTRDLRLSVGPDGNSENKDQSMHRISELLVDELAEAR